MAFCTIGALPQSCSDGYWLLRRRELSLVDLYLPDGAYRYGNGWNGPAVVATLVGCGLAWVGLVVKPLAPLYDYAWFVGAGSAALLYLLLMRGRFGHATVDHS